MDWNDLKIILAIGRQGSLSGAARTLDMNHSTVFRRINAIEDKMGVRFFDRLPQGYSLTEAGEAALRAADKIDNEVNGLSRKLLGKDLRLQGGIRVTAPEGVSHKLLRPIIAEFLKRHPEINIDLVVTGNALKLARREADLAIRVTNNPPDTSIGRKVCNFRFGFYASKEYVEKNTQTKVDQHHWLLLDDCQQWFPASVWKQLGLAGLQKTNNVCLRTDSTTAIVNAAIDSLGVAPLPCFLGDDEEKLVRVFEPDKDIAGGMMLELWVLMHPDLRNTARVRALKNYIYENLEINKKLIEGA